MAPRPIEPAVSQDCAVSPKDSIFRAFASASLWNITRRRVQRIRFGLHPSALADSAFPVGVALRDEMGYAGRVGRGEQVVPSPSVRGPGW